MRLDGGFGNGKLIGDLLVQKPFGEHHQNANLLRRQSIQTFYKIGDFIAIRER